MESLEMYADYVCSFCYLGHASLTQYREGRSEPLTVDSLPAQLVSYVVKTAHPDRWTAFDAAIYDAL